MSDTPFDTPFDTEALVESIYNATRSTTGSNEVQWAAVCELIAAEPEAVGDVINAYMAVLVNKMTPFFAQFSEAWKDSVREALHTISELPTIDRPPVLPTPAAS